MVIPPTLRKFAPWLLTLLLAGCLPSSCNREEERALFPADSASRAFAASLPVDTLEAAGVVDNSEALGLGYPRTAAFAPDGTLWISDTEENVLTAFDPAGAVVRSIDVGDLEYPYIAGFRGDTLHVFSPKTRSVVAFHGSTRIDSTTIPDDLPERGAFQYAAVGSNALYYKAIADDFEGYIAEFDVHGAERRRWNLPGPFWRYAGFLRVWGDSLLSLSGYRPVVYAPAQDAALDSLSLQGFDSPMLARSRRFVTGDLSEPPLLTASAAAAGSYLFVLNMRPGWLRVDAYDHGGRLKKILTQPAPEFNQKYYPTDIAVRHRADGVYEFAVTVVEPKPRVERFVWRDL